MDIKNTGSSYGNVAKAFHWIMFLLLVGVVIIGYYMYGLPAETPEQRGYKFGLYGWHKSFGILVLLLVVLRLGWRIFNPPPKMPGSLSKIEACSAHAMHIMLYIVMFVQPLSGWLMSSLGGHSVKFFGLEIPALAGKDKAMQGIIHEVHEITAIVLIVLFVVHVAAALFHHYVRKDDVLRRMLPHPTKID